MADTPPAVRPPGDGHEACGRCGRARGDAGADGVSACGGSAMKTQQVLVVLSVINVMLLLAAVALQLRPALAQNEGTVLRGRALEIVDGKGRVRASLSVPPPERSHGEGSAETVLLRLITERGRPTVKIGASEPQSGVSFAGPTSTKRTYVILEAKDKTSQLKLRREDGRERVVEP